MGVQPSTYMLTDSKTRLFLTIWVIQSNDDMLTHFRHAAAGGEEGEEEEEW